MAAYRAARLASDGGRGGSLGRTSLGPAYRRLWAASAVSNLGDGVTVVAGPLLAAALTRDPVLVAGLTVAQRTPWLLFSLVSGALVDRLDRRRVMVGVDALRGLVIGALGLVVWLDAASIPLLYVVFFVLGWAETMFENAATAMLPAVVPTERLERANGRLLGARIVTGELAGPPLGGLLFALAAALPFLLDAGSYVAAAALVAALPGGFRTERPAASSSLRADIAEGLRWLWRQELLRLLAVAIAIMNLTLFATTSIMVLVAQERLGLGPVGYGLLLGSLAVGGITGSLVAERVIGRLGAATALRVGLVVEASTHLVIASSRSPLVVGAILALFGLHAVVWSVITVSLRQSIVPGRLLGRVNSAYLLLSAGSPAFGALLGGLLARAFGLTAPFWFAFALVGLLAVVAWPVLSSARVRAARGDAAS
jgi:MFS family permease